MADSNVKVSVKPLEAPAGVVNIRARDRRGFGLTGYVYIGRPSKWGNPFVIGKDGNRDEVVAKFSAWWNRLERSGARPDLFHEAVEELGGKVLGCYCAPKRCHGDVIKESIEAYIQRLWSS